MAPPRGNQPFGKVARQSGTPEVLAGMITPPSSPQPSSLARLVGLRTAPTLDPAERSQLLRELKSAVASCEWFTVGVMAPTAARALQVLRRCETFLGLPQLEPANPAMAIPSTENGAIDPRPVFLKGNQRTGTYLLRSEAGLGEGLLITGHSSSSPAAEDTWGPIPLDLLDEPLPLGGKPIC